MHHENSSSEKVAGLLSRSRSSSDLYAAVQEAVVQPSTSSKQSDRCAKPNKSNQKTPINYLQFDYS